MKNVLLVTLDATRKDVFGIFGSDRGLTPSFDSLREESVIFTKAQNVGPYTQASFPGILTSSFYLEYGQPRELSPKRTIISEPLQKAGIVTAAFHSNPYLCDYAGWNKGWDVFYDAMDLDEDPRLGYIPSDVINRKAMDWLSQHQMRPDPRPFFLWVHYMDVHEPYMPDQRYVDLVDPSVKLKKDQMYELFQAVLMKRDITDRAAVRLLKTLYAAQVREVDIYFKELLNCLDKLKFLHNTVIFVANDHGDEFGEHGGLSHDDKMYSELIDMPLILYGAGETGICDAVVSSIDIPPTIVYLFGLDPVGKFEGHSLLPVEGFSERGAYGEAIDQQSKQGGDLYRDTYFHRERDLKIIYRAGLDGWELYDLSQDPKERKNIINTSPEAERLKEKLKPRVRRWAK